MISDIIDHWIVYFQSRKEIKNDITSWSSVNTKTIPSSPAIIFQAVAKVDKQLSDTGATYPSYDMIIRVISAIRNSESHAFMEAERIADIVTALIRCNPKLYDRQNIFAEGSPYFLNNSDVIGYSYIEDAMGGSERAGSFQKEVKIFLRCYRAEGVNFKPGVSPVYEDGISPPTPEDTEEALGWYMPEDQELYYSGINRDKILLRVYRESELSDIYNVGTGEHERIN